MKNHDTILNDNEYIYNNEELSEITIKDDIKSKQNQLLKILLERFKRKINDQDLNTDIIKIRIKKDFYKGPEEGFELLEELVEAKKFNRFARKNFMYLSNYQFECDAHETECYEIAWNYKQYYESLNSKESSQNYTLVMQNQKVLK